MRNNSRQYGSWYAVQLALAEGRLERKYKCEHCGKETLKTIFHHADTSYKEGNELVVEEICYSCNKKHADRDRLIGL